MLLVNNTSRKNEAHVAMFARKYSLNYNNEKRGLKMLTEFHFRKA